ncbi:MAG: hypothetical protein AABY32_05045 [Nanoarchaeota archaeon]
MEIKISEETKALLDKLVLLVNEKRDGKKGWKSSTVGVVSNWRRHDYDKDIIELNNKLVDSYIGRTKIKYSESYIQCIKKLKLLSDLMSQGQSNSKNADEIRDEMDSLLRDMTPEENQLSGHISESLYIMDGDIKGTKRSESYIEYIKKLKLLHNLISQNNDLENGDKIRDEMDPLWNNMIQEERDLSGHVSAALYIMNKKE